MPCSWERGALALCVVFSLISIVKGIPGILGVAGDEGYLLSRGAARASRSDELTLRVVWFVSHFLAGTPLSLPGCVGVSFWRNVPGSLSTPNHSAAGEVITLWHWPSFFPYLFSPPSLLQAPVLKKELFLCFGVFHRFGGVFLQEPVFLVSVVS